MPPVSNSVITDSARAWLWSFEAPMSAFATDSACRGLGSPVALEDALARLVGFRLAHHRARGVEGEVCLERTRVPPFDDPPRTSRDHERRADQPPPGSLAPTVRIAGRSGAFAPLARVAAPGNVSQQRVCDTPSVTLLSQGEIIMRTFPSSIKLPLVATALLLSGCATAAVEPPPPPPDRTFQYDFPVVDVLEESTNLVTLGGVRISLAPRSFEVGTVNRCEYRRARTSLSDILRGASMPAGVSADTHTEVEEVRYRSPTVSPNRISLVATVTNQLDRVFRGQGSVVQFAIGGRAVSADAVNYSQFLNAIIPPNGEVQVRLEGPPLSSVGESSTIAVNIYDIMSNVDEAGNVTQRDNAEWFFAVRRESREHVSSGERSRQWVPNARIRQVPLDGSLVPCVTGS